MNFIDRMRPTWWRRSVASAFRPLFRIIGASALTLALTANLLPDERGLLIVNGPAASTSVLTFATDADSYVRQDSPSSNYGTAYSLQVNGGSNPAIERFIRFNVTGLSCSIQSAHLRFYA